MVAMACCISELKSFIDFIDNSTIIKDKSFPHDVQYKKINLKDATKLLPNLPYLTNLHLYFIELLDYFYSSYIKHIFMCNLLR